MEDLFDLDQALSMEDQSSGHHGIKISESFPTDHLIYIMPTVATAVGVCTVCMEGFQSSPAGNKQIPCGHVYHATCITKWLSLHNSCPLCRCKVSGHRKNLSATSL